MRARQPLRERCPPQFLEPQPREKATVWGLLPDLRQLDEEQVVQTVDQVDERWPLVEVLQPLTGVRRVVLVDQLLQEVTVEWPRLEPPSELPEEDQVAAETDELLSVLQRVRLLRPSVREAHLL